MIVMTYITVKSRGRLSLGLDGLSMCQEAACSSLQRKRAALGCCMSLLAVLCSTFPVAAQEEVVEITVTGQGISEDAAKNDALRKALEQGGKVEISSHSNVANFELIRDSIYARADGIVSDYRILEQGDAGGGIKFCRVHAKVTKNAIASTWGEVQNVLDQIGQPGIAVYIKETIDGVVQESSILESVIENRLVNKGFKVYDTQQLLAKLSREELDAAAEGNENKQHALAKDFVMQIFITGHAHANAAGLKELEGRPTAMYNGDAVIKMYYTDTAQLLASESLANWRGGAQGFHETSPQAGKKALENAGAELVDRLYHNVMKRWSTQISAGGELSLEVEGMDMGDAIRLKKKLKDINPDKILSVNGPSATKGIITFRIKAKMTAEEFAEYLVEGEFASMIGVVDLKSNRIQAKWIGK